MGSPFGNGSTKKFVSKENLTWGKKLMSPGGIVFKFIIRTDGPIVTEQG